MQTTIPDWSEARQQLRDWGWLRDDEDALDVKDPMVLETSSVYFQGLILDGGFTIEQLLAVAVYAAGPGGLLPPGTYEG